MLKIEKEIMFHTDQMKSYPITKNKKDCTKVTW